MGRCGQSPRRNTSQYVTIVWFAGEHTTRPLLEDRRSEDHAGVSTNRRWAQDPSISEQSTRTPLR